MIGLLLPFWLNLGGGGAPPVIPAVVVRGSAKALPLTVLAVADVVPLTHRAEAEVVPLTVHAFADVS